MRPAHLRRFIPRCLALESRDVPTGNITATLFGSYLQIDGDAADNTVILRGKGPGVVEVQGVNTTLNGGNKKLTFTGVDVLWVDSADGNDSVQTHDLVVGFIGVYGGAGDDSIHLNRSTNPRGIAILADDSSSMPNDYGVNGEDTIRVTGTNAAGGLYLDILGDSYSEGKHDSITVENTTITDGGSDEVYLDFFITGSLSMQGAGDDITIDDIKVSVDAWQTGVFVAVAGTPAGDDHIRIRNCDIEVQAEGTAYAYITADGYGWMGGGGGDTIEVENVSFSATTSQSVGYNDVGCYFLGDTVRVNNLDVVGGGTFLDFDGNEYTTGGAAYIYGSDVTIRNTSVHTNGWGSLIVSTPEYLDGIERDVSWSLTNVQVTSADGQLSDLSLFAGRGNDHLEVTNASSEIFQAALDEGDDTLQLTNVTGDISTEYGWGSLGGIWGSGGNDTVNMVNCTFLNQFIDLGEGDDTLKLVNNSFVALVADLGDGDDTATVTNNTATTSLAIDGGDGTDTLIAWLNVAPLLELGNFEL